MRIYKLFMIISVLFIFSIGIFPATVLAKKKATATTTTPETTTTLDVITSLYVDPSSNRLSVGETFLIYIYVEDVVDMVGFDFKLGYDTTILDIAGVSVTPLSVWGDSYFIAKNKIDEASGVYWLGVTSFPLVPFDGTTSLVTLTFEVTGTGTSDLDLYDTKLVDSSVELIPHELGHGNFDSVTCWARIYETTCKHYIFSVYNFYDASVRGNWEGGEHAHGVINGYTSGPYDPYEGYTNYLDYKIRESSLGTKIAKIIVHDANENIICGDSVSFTCETKKCAPREWSCLYNSDCCSYRCSGGTCKPATTTTTLPYTTTPRLTTTPGGGGGGGGGDWPKPRRMLFDVLDVLRIIISSLFGISR